MNISDLPSLYAHSVHFAELRNNCADPDGLALHAQLSVNAFLSDFGNLLSETHTADTFLNYNPALFTGRNFFSFSVTVQLFNMDKQRASACAIIFIFDHEKGLKAE